MINECKEMGSRDLCVLTSATSEGGSVRVDISSRFLNKPHMMGISHVKVEKDVKLAFSTGWDLDIKNRGK